MSISLGSSLSRGLAYGVAALVLACGTEPPRLASLEIISGNGQTGIAGSALPVPLQVKAEDENGSPIEGVRLRFEATAGGGQLRPAEVATDREGRAEAEFILGSVPGSQEVTISSVSGEVAARLTATATGVPASVRLFGGNSQSARAGLAVATPPAVVVLDAAGRPVPGVTVSFGVTEGGGSLIGTSTPTDVDGIARVGQWRLGVSGVNTMDAVVDGAAVAGEPVTFVATTTPPAGYDVVVRFTEPPTPAEALAFARAEVRWEEIITGDLPDGSIDVPAGTCGSGTPALNEAVDDVLILAAFHSVDGAGNVLAQAGPCLFRDANGDGGYQVGELPGVGIMQFDADDLDYLVQNDLLGPVVLHEMGHVLGIGSLWSDMGLLADPSPPPQSGSDPHFTGSAAVAAFDAAGGTAYLGASVPVENRGGPGTADVHWRESVLGEELMTGFIDLGPNPLSAISAASLADQGYEVDQARADPYTMGSTLRLNSSRPSVPLPADVLRLPLRRMGSIK
ncbi:MAG: leishmanolysin-related zinc metalloendopeptidase [Gemmatimonadales bacterium]